MLYLIVTVGSICSCYGNSVARATVIVLQQIVLSVCVDTWDAFSMSQCTAGVVHTALSALCICNYSKYTNYGEHQNVYQVLTN